MKKNRKILVNNEEYIWKVTTYTKYIKIWKNKILLYNNKHFENEITPHFVKNIILNNNL